MCSRFLIPLATLMLFSVACSDVGEIVDPTTDMDQGTTPEEMGGAPVDMGEDESPSFEEMNVEGDMPADLPTELAAPKELQAVPSAEGVALSWLPARGAVRYEVRVDGGPWKSTGAETSFMDAEAPGGAVLSAMISASDMTGRPHVTLQAADIMGEDGPERRYEVRAVHEDGASMPTTPVTARRTFALQSVQWERRDDDDPSTWLPLPDSTGESSVDTTAAPEGDAHHYRAILTPIAGEPFTSGEDEGARLAAVRVSAGGLHACALMNNGKVACWGDNHYGQLGLNHMNDVFEDSNFKSLKTALIPKKVKSISSGIVSTCALSEDSELYCWGNLTSQISFNYTSNGEISKLETTKQPKDIPRNHAAHFCYITNENDIVCFGDNSLGQLGYESTVNYPQIPDQIVDIGSEKANQLSLNMTNLFRTCILTESNKILCWGALWQTLNQFQNVGDQSGEMPPPITFQLPTNQPISQISQGSLANMCVLSGTIDIACWGSGSNGMLGNLTMNSSLPPGVFPNIAITRTRTVDISLGTSNTCALQDTGELYCWGKGDGGLNGSGHQDNIGDDETDVPVTPLALGGRVQSVNVSPEIACAIVSGEVLCWGRNLYGMLGRKNIPLNSIIGDDPGEMPPLPVELW